MVGLEIEEARHALGLTQEELAARCQLAGLDISRSTLGQIEARLRYVSDGELLMLASLLRVATDDLYPIELRKRLRSKRLAIHVPARPRLAARSGRSIRRRRP